MKATAVVWKIPLFSCSHNNSMQTDAYINSKGVGGRRSICKWDCSMWIFRQICTLCHIDFYAQFNPVEPNLDNVLGASTTPTTALTFSQFLRCCELPYVLSERVLYAEMWLLQQQQAMWYQPAALCGSLSRPIVAKREWKWPYSFHLSWATVPVIR